MKNIALLFILFTSTCFHSSAQYMIKQWDYRFGGSDDDFLFTIQKTTDGGYILGGNSASPISGDKTQASQGVSDYWIVKINSNGIKQWDKRYGGSNYENIAKILQTSDGGYLIGGTSVSGISGDKTQTSRGGTDFWIVKIDSIGTKLWDFRFGGDSSDNMRSLIENYPGGYVLSGSSKSTATGDKSQGSQGDFDYWAVYIDYYGYKFADYRFGGNNYEELTAIQETNDGGQVYGGTTLSGISGDKTQSSRGGLDNWLVKLDNYGSIQWDYRFGGNDHDQLSDLITTTDKGYLIGSTSISDSSGDKTQYNWNNSIDNWVIKIDSNGSKQWDYRYGGNLHDYLSSVKQTKEGGYVLGGYSNSSIGGNKSTYVTCTFLNHYWLVKLKSNGLKQWEYSYGGNNECKMMDVLQTADGGYLMGGNSSSGIACDKTQASRGGYDYWIVKLRPNWPTTDANLTITNSGATGKYLSWNNGNGARRIVLVRAGSPITDTPTIGVNYHASSVFGVGDHLSNGTYVAYNGTGTNVTISGLSYSTTYYFKVIAFSPDTLFPVYQQPPYLSGSSVNLPVKWLDVNAKAIDEKTVELNWRTASEINNSHFEIERSFNPSSLQEQWKMIGKVKGKGTTDIVSTYEYIDGARVSFNNAKLYYRIKQVDLDGNFDYSKTVDVQFNKALQEGIEVYPNPFTDKLMLRSATENTGVKITITDCIGKLVFEGVYDFKMAGEEHEINLQHITSTGMYFVSMNGNTLKLIKVLP